MQETTNISSLPERLAADTQLVKSYLDKIDAFQTDSLSAAEAADYKRRILDALASSGAKMVAHYYTDPVLQDLAEESGGFVGDSLEMARFGRDCDASTLIVAGVRFMGESAKILSPDKRVIMPTLEATCSLDIACPIFEFSAFCDANPDRTVVVYANTSAAVKARADWVVTSSVALDIVEHLMERGEKILWAPDRHLGRYIRDTTGADMLLWDSACIVHEEFKARGLRDMRALYPDAAVLAHPERFAGKAVGLVLTGGNIDTRLLSSLLLRDLARSRRLARFRIELIDVPGQLSSVSHIIAEAGGNVTDVAYHKTFSDLPAKVTYIDISLEAQDAAHMDRIHAALRQAGFRV